MRSPKVASFFSPAQRKKPKNMCFEGNVIDKLAILATVLAAD